MSWDSSCCLDALDDRILVACPFHCEWWNRTITGCRKRRQVAFFIYGYPIEFGSGILVLSHILEANVDVLLRERLKGETI